MEELRESLQEQLRKERLEFEEKESALHRELQARESQLSQTLESQSQMFVAFLLIHCNVAMFLLFSSFV